MLDLYTMQSVLNRVEYKPGWELDVYDTEAQGIFFRVQARMEDSYHPGEVVDLSIESQVPMVLIETMQDFIAWVRWRLEVIEIHECHEWLRFKPQNGEGGKPVFDPHGPNATKPKGN